MTARLLIAEELTRPLLERHARLIGACDAAWAFLAFDGRLAVEALDDGRWKPGDFPLFDAADAALAKWAHRTASRQPLRDSVAIAVERDLVSYGLQARLRGPARALAMLGRMLDETGTARLAVVASDPYIRHALTRSARRDPRLTGAELYRRPEVSPLALRLREMTAGSRWSRGLQHTVTSLRHPVPPRGGAKRVGLFILSQRFLDLFTPIATELRARGWETLMFNYAPLPRPPAGAIPFGRAASTRRLRLAMPDRPRWRIDDDVLRSAPVSPDWISRALDASWLTGWLQRERHRHVLTAWRPDVVVSFGPDIMSLALQATAAEAGIPSVFMPHGFLVPTHSQCFVHATATAVPGWPCVDANAVNALGEAQNGLVATGHPNYDEILRDTSVRAREDVRAAIDAPPSRQYLLVVFAEWGVDLLLHAMQRRALEMVARALPDDVFLVCKLHPGREEREMCDALLGRYLPPMAFHVIADAQLTTPALLAVCDVTVATERSMCLSDAVVRGLPAIAIRHPENPYGSGDLNHPSKDFREVCWRVEDVGGLRRAIVSLTRDPDARAHLVRHRRRYIERFLLAADARSSVRVAELIEHLAAGKEPRTFVPTIGEALVE